MSIGEAEVAAGHSGEWFVVRSQAGSGVSTARADFLIGQPHGVIAHREVAGGLELGGVTYRLVRLEPDAVSSFISSAQDLEGVSVQPVVFGESTRSPNSPNDPLLRGQYAIENYGQEIGGRPGVPGADVGVARAWDLQLGSAQVRVAVIDSGVSRTHPDLASKLDDGINVTGGPLSDTDAPYNTHGTHIAGIVAASTNNARGVVGVSWGSRIVPVKAANILGFTSDVWLAEGLVWAANEGVDVAVMSFGLSGASDVLADAVRYAYDRGVVICASSGNDAQRAVRYPAAYPEVIAVGATDNADRIATFSNYGPEVELVAPGVDILSTTHTIFEPHTYDYASGTSFSTPIVAGVAALLRSARPDLTVDEIRTVLARTSRDLGPSFGRDEVFGFGRVNAHRALQFVMGESWCYADLDDNGFLEPADFSAWVGLYNAGDLRADQNMNDVVEPGDLNAFVVNYRVNTLCD